MWNIFSLKVGKGKVGKGRVPETTVKGDSTTWQLLVGARVTILDQNLVSDIICNLRRESRERLQNAPENSSGGWAAINLRVAGACTLHYLVEYFPPSCPSQNEVVNVYARPKAEQPMSHLKTIEVVREGSLIRKKRGGGREKRR